MIINNAPSSSHDFIDPTSKLPTQPATTLNQALLDLDAFKNAAFNTNPPLFQLLENFSTLLNNAFTQPSASSFEPLQWDNPPAATGMGMILFFKGLLVNNLTTFPYSPTTTSDPTVNALIQYLSSFAPTEENSPFTSIDQILSFFSSPSNPWGAPDIYNSTFLQKYIGGFGVDSPGFNLSPIQLMADMETTEGWQQLATFLVPEAGDPYCCSDPGLTLLMLCAMNNIPITPPSDITSNQNRRNFCVTFINIFSSNPSFCLPSSLCPPELNIYRNFANLLTTNNFRVLKSSQSLGSSYQTKTLPQQTPPLPPYSTLSENQQALWITLTGLNLPSPTQD